MDRRLLTVFGAAAIAATAAAGPAFLPSLPFDPGPTPRGLSSTTAGGCAGCHADVANEWAQSPHATGATSAAFAHDPAVMADPDCRVCHLPIADQHPNRWGRDAAGELSEVENDRWDPFLGHEGVTCAACHVRDGAVLAAKVSGRAPHPVVESQALTSVEACAGCHQLAWSGADEPWYDTVGEWERGPFGRAGVSCQDCHMGPGAGRAARGHDHRLSRAVGAGITVISRMDGRPARSGAATLTLVLQNTGAGHAIPTGSPRRGLLLRVQLTRPDAPEQAISLLEAPLTRTFSPKPPYTILTDTRVPSGGQRRFEVPVSLPEGAPEHGWSLDARLIPTWDGAPQGDPTWSRVVPIP